jgi:recombination protein RecA
MFINQLRMKIGVMFGNPETTTGGNALKFYASIRLDIRRVSPIKNGEEVVGSRTRVKVVKNKMAAPFRQTEFDMMHGEGVARTGELLDLAVEKRIVEKSGAWYSYKGERIGQGRDNSIQFLKDNTDLHGKVEAEVLEAYGIGPAKAAAKNETAHETEAAAKTSKAAKKAAAAAPEATA